MRYDVHFRRNKDALMYQDVEVQTISYKGEGAVWVDFQQDPDFSNDKFLRIVQEGGAFSFVNIDYVSEIIPCD
ncbi:hypothetical protein [Parvularcula sp. IMCC14364]|uniref:hypothetical protein n=1 Tax=Parvularcula sp. IMCC14364 TaxID=3067902 RepID=UPI0027410924|nr:hypothetical protein [Parvularcula sp. IMCC14364]